jgi:hypothetical protein
MQGETRQAASVQAAAFTLPKDFIPPESPLSNPISWSENLRVPCTDAACRVSPRMVIP